MGPVGLALLLPAALPTERALGQVQPPPAAEETKTVRVTAEGYNRDDAVKQALRRALEQGAGVQLASFSEVANFELIRDTIYSRASGIVTDYRVLEESEGPGGTVIMTIEATVRASAIAQAWGELQNVLDQIGRPKIMVWIEESIDDQPQRDSITEARIAEMFVKAGFDLVDRKGVGDLIGREIDSAKDAEQAAKLNKYAKEAGAHILIRGAANADRAGIEDIYGVRAAMYNCDVQARVYWTDTAKLIASESIPVTRRGVRAQQEYSPQAARTALVEATFPEEDAKRRKPALAVRLFESVMEQWSIQISAGGDITLEVSGVDFKQYLDIRKAIQELERIVSVDGDFTSGIATYRIKAKMSAETFAELMTRKPFENWMEVSDLKPGRVQARAKK
jgi:hypothetical protein